MADSSVVPYDPNKFLVLGPKASKAKSAMAQAFKGTINNKKLTRIKTPSGGGKNWEIPNLEGGTASVPSFDGVVVYTRPARAWWKEDYAGGGERPDCYSMADDPESDMVRGVTWTDPVTGEKRGPGMRCKKCPHNQWGSDRKGGKGKDCGERNQVYLMREDSAIPDLINLPTMSLGNAEDYFLKLAGRALDPWDVVTKFTLEQDKGGPSGKIEYSKAVLTRAAELDEQSALVFGQIGEALKAKLLETSADSEWDDEDEDDEDA